MVSINYPIQVQNIYPFWILYTVLAFLVKSLCASNYVCENMNIKTTIKTSRLFYPAHYSSMVLTEFQAFGNM